MSIPTARLLAIKEGVFSAHRQMQRYGSLPLRSYRGRDGLHRSSPIVRVSLAESDWLAKNKPSWLPYTKICTPTVLWKSDMDRPSSAQYPVIREIWVGQRSLACVGEDDVPEGHSNSAKEQEEIAELTDLQTMLYEGHESLRRSAIFKRALYLYRNVRRKHPEFTWPRRKKLWKLAVDEANTEFASAAIIEDPETGEPRFIRPGDIVQVVWGSNEDLDALYMEEAASDRSEHDSLLRDLNRDQIRPNSYREAAFLEDPDYVLHRDVLTDDEIIAEDEFPEVEWFTRSDYFAALERNTRQRERVATKNARKAPPAPVDWKAVRAR